MAHNYLYDSIQAAIKAGLLVGKLGGVRHERFNPSENGTTVPNARLITDSQGGCWSLGNEYAYKKDGHLMFNVIRNDKDMDIMAERIEMRDGRVWIFNDMGWHHWSYNRNTFI
jgi:hypothetical protein